MTQLARSRRFTLLLAAATAATSSLGLAASASGANGRPATSSHKGDAQSSAVAVASRAGNGRILFTDGSTGQIYAIKPDGTDLRQLTHLGVGQAADAGSWSPTGTRIVFDAVLENDNRVFVMSDDGTGVHQFMDDDPGWQDVDPHFTPDESHIVYTRCRPDPPAGCAVFIVTTSGTERHAITQFGPTDESSEFGGIPSPNGREIAFERYNQGGYKVRLWTTRLDGSNERPVTAPALEAGLPDGSPDGKHLVVSSNVAEQLGRSLYVIGANGGRPHRLTNSHFPQSDWYGTYSPTGNKIAFISNRDLPDLSGRGLWVMNADGTGVHRVTTAGLSHLFRPDWGPSTS
jgi:Tol biopolymer transport system component